MCVVKLSTPEYLILFKYPADLGDLDLNVQKSHTYILKMITSVTVYGFCSPLKVAFGLVVLKTVTHITVHATVYCVPLFPCLSPWCIVSVACTCCLLAGFC
jgi:hypothetical protein